MLDADVTSTNAGVQLDGNQTNIVDVNLKMSKKVDPLSKTSERPGIAGKIETILRRYRGFIYTLLLLPIFFIYVFCMAVSLAPAIWIVLTTHAAISSWTIIPYCLAISIAAAISFWVAGVTLIFVVPFVNWALRIKPKPWRGSAYSLESIPWYYHNALTSLVRYTILDLVTPSPLTVLFYKMMGMKIGKNVVISTTNITDPCLITLEDNVSLGGSSHVIGHYANKGYLILAPVVIKKNTFIGLKATIFGDVVVGERVLVKANTVLMPKSRVNDDTVVG
jgi:hypothetical protein